MIDIREEAGRCLLCENAPCSAVCRKGDPARGVRAIRFDNPALAGAWFSPCTQDELAAAEQACIHYDRPIRLREIAAALPPQASAEKAEKPSLAIRFCGIPCENPFFLASSAVCTNYEMVSAALKAGWAGVFYKTICRQDIHEVSPRFDAVRDGRGPFIGFRNMEQLSENPMEMDFDILRRLKRNFPGKVVVASIMGEAEQDWIELARMAEDAGVDAVELNFSCPQMRMAGMGSDVGQSAELVSFYTAFVKRSVKIPVIPKMTPNIGSVGTVAMGALLAGADGISAINTIKSVTLSDTSAVNSRKVVSGYSGKAIKPIALRFILEITKNPLVALPQVSGIGGIETWRDALDFISLGCRNVQVCTAVMQYGYRIIDDLVLGLRNYLAEKGIDSLETLVGCELDRFVRPRDESVPPLQPGQMHRMRPLLHLLPRRRTPGHPFRRRPAAPADRNQMRGMPPVPPCLPDGRHRPGPADAHHAKSAVGLVCSAQRAAHDIIVHVEPVPDREIAFAEDFQTQVFIEVHRRVVAVHVQFDAAGPAVGGPAHKSADVFVHQAADAKPPESGQQIDLLQFEKEGAVRLKAARLHGHIAAGLAVGLGDEIDVAVLPHLPLQAGLRIHPFHHIIHLSGGKNVPVRVAEGDLRQRLDERDVVGRGPADCDFGFVGTDHRHCILVK